jgi:hypothetical protein
MVRIAELEDIIRQEIESYTGEVYKATSYLITDSKQHTYIVVVVPDHDYPTRAKPGIVVMARVVGDKVVIDEDITDRPLYEELMRAGIPREQIVLAYAGETLSGESAGGES